MDTNELVAELEYVNSRLRNNTIIPFEFPRMEAQRIVWHRKRIGLLRSLEARERFRINKNGEVELESKPVVKVVKRIPGAALLKKIEALWDVTYEDILSGSRKAHIADARAVYMFCLLESGLSTYQAGKAVNRHHATAVQARYKVIHLYTFDKEFREKMNLLGININGTTTT